MLKWANDSSIFWWAAVMAKNGEPRENYNKHQGDYGQHITILAIDIDSHQQPGNGKRVASIYSWFSHWKVAIFIIVIAKRYCRSS